MPKPTKAQPTSSVQQLRTGFYTYHPDPRVETLCESLAIGLPMKEALKHSRITDRTWRRWKADARELGEQHPDDWRVRAVSVMHLAIAHARREMLQAIRVGAKKDWRAAHALLQHLDQHLLSSERASAYSAQRVLDLERTKLIKEQIMYSHERRAQLKLMCEQLRLKIEELSGKNPEGAREAFKQTLMMLESADPTLGDEQRAARLKLLEA